MVTAVSGFIEQVGNMIKTHLLSINPLTIPSSFKELAQTLTIASSSISWLLPSSEPDNSQQMDACELVYIAK